MKFDELQYCPFCKCGEFYTKQRVSGTIHFRERFDGREANNEEMYDSLIYSPDSERVYCGGCRRILGNKAKNTVTKAVETAIKEEERSHFRVNIPME